MLALIILYSVLLFVAEHLDITARRPSAARISRRAEEANTGLSAAEMRGATLEGAAKRSPGVQRHLTMLLLLVLGALLRSGSALGVRARGALVPLLCSRRQALGASSESSENESLDVDMMLRIDSLSQKAGGGGDSQSAQKIQQKQLKEIKAAAKSLKLQHTLAAIYPPVESDPDEDLVPDEFDGEGREEEEEREKRQKVPGNALNALRDFESHVAARLSEDATMQSSESDSFDADFANLVLAPNDDESLSLRKKLQESFSAGPPSYDGPTCVKCKRPASAQEMNDFGGKCSLCRQEDLLISPAQARRSAPSSSAAPVTAQVLPPRSNLKKGKKGAADQTLSTEHEQSETPEGIFEYYEEFDFDPQDEVDDIKEDIRGLQSYICDIEDRLKKVEKKLEESETNIEKLKAAAAKKRSKEKSP